MHMVHAAHWRIKISGSPAESLKIECKTMVSQHIEIWCFETSKILCFCEINNDFIDDPGTNRAQRSRYRSSDTSKYLPISQLDIAVIRMVHYSRDLV